MALWSKSGELARICIEQSWQLNNFVRADRITGYKLDVRPNKYDDDDPAMWSLSDEDYRARVAPVQCIGKNLIKPMKSHEKFKAEERLV